MASWQFPAERDTFIGPTRLRVTRKWIAAGASNPTQAAHVHPTDSGHDKAAAGVGNARTKMGTRAIRENEPHTGNRGQLAHFPAGSWVPGRAGVSCVHGRDSAAWQRNYSAYLRLSNYDPTSSLSSSSLSAWARSSPPGLPSRLGMISTCACWRRWRYSGPGPPCSFGFCIR
jgi:hypothetical protein